MPATTFGRMRCQAAKVHPNNPTPGCNLLAAGVTESHAMVFGFLRADSPLLNRRGLLVFIRLQAIFIVLAGHTK